jgi:hypothetical protein
MHEVTAALAAIEASQGKTAFRATRHMLQALHALLEVVHEAAEAP